MEGIEREREKRHYIVGYGSTSILSPLISPLLTRVTVTMNVSSISERRKFEVIKIRENKIFEEIMNEISLIKKLCKDTNKGRR